MSFKILLLTCFIAYASAGILGTVTDAVSDALVKVDTSAPANNDVSTDVSVPTKTTYTVYCPIWAAAYAIVKGVFSLSWWTVKGVWSLVSTVSSYVF